MKKIILLGYMGSGKTTVAKLLSATLHIPFYDLDDFIEAKEGIPVTTIFKEKGELYFRKNEAIYLKEIIQSEQKLILALGGGTPCFGANLDVLQSSSEVITVYLHASYNTLSKRLYPIKNTRPLISHVQTNDDLEDFIKKHLFERFYYYNQAYHKINTDDLSFQEIVEKIVLKLF